MKLPNEVFQAELLETASRRATVTADYAEPASDQPTVDEHRAFRTALEALRRLEAAKRELQQLEQGPGALSRIVQTGLHALKTTTRMVRWYPSGRKARTDDATTTEAPEGGKSPEQARDEAQKRVDRAQAWANEAARPSSDLGLAGLALSGGGIRSATFNLGVLQAFCKRGLFDQFDYLSTVSGGGYVGGMMSSLLAGGNIRPSAEDFPLRHDRGKEESPEIKHLRSGANYLAPRGVLDKIRIPALFLRGLVVNLALLLPYLLWAVVLTELVYGPSLRHAQARIAAHKGVAFDTFYGPTFLLAAILVLWVFVFAPIRSAVPMNWEWRNHLERAFSFGFLITIVIATVNSLPLVVLVFRAYDFNLNFVASGGLGTIVTLGAPLLPLVLASGAPRPLNTWQGKLMVYLLGLMGPVILLLIYIQLASWRVFCVADGAPDCPGWWLVLVDGVKDVMGSEPILRLQPLDVALAGVGVILFVYGWQAVDVNLTSLHGFYRDRLSRAYLFNQATRSAKGPEEPTPPSNDRLRLSDLAPQDSSAPYHLVNATLNLQASRALQGRHADFFLFSKRFVGSAVTDYVPTPQLEAVDSRLDLATAVAISGAALAPNMGTSTNRALVFVMTLLNVRTGYWLPNPKKTKFLVRALKGVGPVYLLLELFGLVHEKSAYVNVSDGGHVENLGLYELLRRRCRYIVVCDAEADPDLAFDGLAKVMRYARIDGGVEIDLNVDRLRKDAQGMSRAHYAVGKIRYGKDSEGLLVYIKATLCGNETEDIRSYRARSAFVFPAAPFPHEPTTQQFFNEGQFEAYRALGYHIADNALDDGGLDGKKFGKGITMDAWVASLDRAQKISEPAMWS